MEFCQRCPDRKTFKGEVTPEIMDTSNKVECVKMTGETCECWMEYPTDQPYHDKETVIRMNGRGDSGVAAIYYLASACLMGAPGMIWLIVKGVQHLFA